MGTGSLRTAGRVVDLWLATAWQDKLFASYFDYAETNIYTTFSNYRSLGFTVRHKNMFHT